MKTIHVNKANFKKLVKEKTILESECQKIQESIRTNNRSFLQAVRSHLINSNKAKYLTMYGDAVVPLTKIINLDLSILQKYYDSRVLPNLDEESRLFEQIICSHNSKFKSSKTSINAKLIESVRKIESRIHRSDVLAHIGTPESGQQATNYTSTTASAPLNSINSQQFAKPTTMTSIYVPQIATSVSCDSTHNGTPASINSAGTQSTTPLSSFNPTHTPHTTSMNTPNSMHFPVHNIGKLPNTNNLSPNYKFPSFISTLGSSTAVDPPFYMQSILTQQFPNVACPPQPHS